MTLQLRSILGRGDLRTERITFRVLSDIDVGDYIVMRVPLFEGNLMTEVENAFWFPFESVLKGDLVVLYSKIGLTRKRDLESGKQTHFFYWGQEEAIWGDVDISAVLAHAPDWTAKSVSDLSK